MHELCGSRKYPYPHHGRLFDSYPPYPPGFSVPGGLNLNSSCSVKYKCVQNFPVATSKAIYFFFRQIILFFLFLLWLLLMMDLFSQLSNIFGDLKGHFYFARHCQCLTNAGEFREVNESYKSLLYICIYSKITLRTWKFLQRVVLGKHFFLICWKEPEQKSRV